MGTPRHGAGYGRPQAEQLMQFLLTWEGPHLPRLQEIAKLTRMRTHYNVWAALKILQDQGRIYWVHGTRSVARGHQAIRIRSNGKALMTEGCPLTMPG